MRYRIECRNGSAEYPLYQPEEKTLLISSARLIEQMNDISCMVLSMPLSNVNSEKISRLESEIIVTDSVDGAELFSGRVTSDITDIYGNKTETCQDRLSYLRDTQYPPGTYSGSIGAFIQGLLKNHNAKVQSKQKLLPGNITVQASGESFRWESDTYACTLDIIKNDVLNVFGGFLQIRRQGNENYLDYLAEYPVSDQTARLGENILELTRCIHAENVCTAIMPLGAVINIETGERLKIGSVNGGSDYLMDTAFMSKYGWIEKVVEFDEVTRVEELLAKGKAYMEQCANMVHSLKLNMIDGRCLGLDVSRIFPGMRVKVESELHGMNTYFLCTSRETDLLEPENSKIILSDKFTCSTDVPTIRKSERRNRMLIRAVKHALTEQIQSTRTDLFGALEKMPGLYKTKLTQPDSTIIYYFHNKEKKEESDIQMSFTDIGFQISVDRGTTWFGLAVDGNTISTILNNTGINADWIRTGALKASLLSSGKIQSANYKKDTKNGLEIDLDTGNVKHCVNGTTMSTVANGIKAQSSGVTANYVVEGMDISESASGIKTAAGQKGFSILDQKNSKYLLNMKTDTAKRKVTLTINGHEGKTGKAEFSDGSYMNFENGILIGGYTKETGTL